MAKSLDIPDLIRFRKLTKQHNLRGFQCDDSEIQTTCHVTHTRGAIYTMTSPEGSTCSMFLTSSTLSGECSEAYVRRESMTSKLLSQLAPGVAPSVLCIDNGIVVYEDLRGYSPLHDRLTQSKVDHGITCSVASRLANIHRVTHRENLHDISPTVCSVSPGSERYQHLCDVNQLRSTLPLTVRHAAESLLGQQSVIGLLGEVRQVYQANQNCLLHGHISTKCALVSGMQSVMFLDWGSSEVGPGSYDLGCLVASYMTCFHDHMLTEEDNQAHRQTAYAMQDAVNKTIETYIAEFGGLDECEPDLLPRVAAFTGAELIRRAVSTDTDDARDVVRVCMLQTGERLLKRFRSIDNPGRLLMIGLQLC